MAPRPHSSPAPSPAGAASVAAVRTPFALKPLFRRYVLALKRHGVPRAKADRLVRWMATQVNAIYGGTQ